MKKLWTILFVLCMCVTNVQLVHADGGSTNVKGTHYIFPDENDYEFSKEKEGEETLPEQNTYGTFKLNGAIVSTLDDEAFTEYIVPFGEKISFSYDYNQKYTNVSSGEDHLVEDDGYVIDDISLDYKIKNGAIVLQTSKDRKNWQTVYAVCDAFSQKLEQHEPFYTATDLEISQGTYYRMVVAYETGKKIGSKNYFIYSKDQYEYIKHTEVYELYLISDKAKQEKVSEASKNKFAIGTLKYVDNQGFTGDYEIDNDNIHYGWTLGSFYLTGFTSHKVIDGKDVFIKNPNDKVTLWFKLEQDINKLNKIDGVKIYDDQKNYDMNFETVKQKFGRGTFIVQETNHENIKSAPQMFVNYLSGSASLNADTIVQLFEEGDYNCALDYGIEYNGTVLGLIPDKKHQYFRIPFEFSVRNGNTMAYIKDAISGSELLNKNLAPNGFTVSFKHSNYLEVTVKKEVMNETSNGLVEDVRFNRPCKNGEAFIEEGVYTITINNPYVNNEPTIKKIYIGNDDILKAHVKMNQDVSLIKSKVDDGAKIEEDGSMDPYLFDDTYKINSKADFNLLSVVPIVLIIGVSAYLLIKNKNKVKGLVKKDEENS